MTTANILDLNHNTSKIDSISSIIQSNQTSGSWQQLLSTIQTLGPIKLGIPSEIWSLKTICEPECITYDGFKNIKIAGKGFGITLPVNIIKDINYQQIGDIWEPSNHKIKFYNDCQETLLSLSPTESSDWFCYHNLTLNLEKIRANKDNNSFDYSFDKNNPSTINKQSKQPIYLNHYANSQYAFDLSLLAPVIETLCDQTHPIQISLNHNGVTHSGVQSFYQYNNKFSIINISNRFNKLTIDVNKLKYGWVTNLNGYNAKIHLRNGDGSTHITLEDSTSPDRHIDDLWPTLIRALIS